MSSSFDLKVFRHLLDIHNWISGVRLFHTTGAHTLKERLVTYTWPAAHNKHSLTPCTHGQTGQFSNFVKRVFCICAGKESPYVDSLVQRTITIKQWRRTKSMTTHNSQRMTEFISKITWTSPMPALAHHRTFSSFQPTQLMQERWDVSKTRYLMNHSGSGVCH